MADIGNRTASMRLQCEHCAWVPPEDMKIEAALLHMQVDHDIDQVEFDLAVVCTCGAAMTFIESQPTGGGFKDYMRCDACGNTGFVKRAGGD